MSKIFNSKTLAIALSVVMVVCAFCATLSVSADSENLLAGASYTYTMNSFQGGGEDAESTLLTDGTFRGDANGTAFNGNSGVKGVTVELAGTYFENLVEFAFDDATSVGTIVIRNARVFEQLNGTSFNRHCNVAAVEVTTDGLNYTAVEYTTDFVGVEGAPLYAIEQGGEEFDQFYDIFVTVTGAADIMGLRVKLTTEKLDGSYAYIVHLDEIEAYAPGVEAPVRGGETEEPSSSEDSVSSDDTTEESVSSDDTVPSVPVADTTYTVVLTENEDGTYTITAAVPADVDSGKICITVSDDLALVAGSLKSIAGAQKNEAYDRDGVSGVAVTFASDSILDEGTVVFTADYTAAEGAEIDASDITVGLWNLGANGDRVATEADGDVVKEFAPIVPSEPSVPSEESNSSDDTTEESVSSDDTTEESVSSDDTTEESAPVDKPSSPTGDAGIAVFAVLAVLSGAAVVVLKKRA